MRFLIIITFTLLTSIVASGQSADTMYHPDPRINKFYGEVFGKEGVRAEGLILDELTLVVTSDSLLFVDGNGVVKYKRGFDAADIAFDSNKEQLREYGTGVNIGGSTMHDFMNYLYFAPPTLSAITFDPVTTVYEIGTSNSIVITGSVSNSGGSTLSDGYLVITSETPDVNYHFFDDSLTYTRAFQFNPRKENTGDYNKWSYTFKAQQVWTKAGEGSDTEYSPAKTVIGVYPVFYGVHASDFRLVTGTTIYTSSLTNWDIARGSKTVTLNGTGWAYFIVPQEASTWTVAEIKDQNGFPVLWDEVILTISSNALDDDWLLKSYKMYVAKNIAEYISFEFDFNL